MKYALRVLAVPFLVVAFLCHCVCGEEAVQWWGVKLREWGMR